MKQTFVIQGRLEGLNSRINADRTNRFAGAKFKKENMKLITAYIYLYHLKPMKSPVWITITWAEPNCRRDKDNVASAKKDIFDALVSCEILQNDGWKDIAGFTDKFEIDSKNPHITVDLVEICNNDTERRNNRCIKEVSEEGHE